MKKVSEEIGHRDIFQISTEQLENGERPGWVYRCTYFVEGERIILVITVQKKLPHWKAIISIIRIRFQIIIESYVPNT